MTTSELRSIKKIPILNKTLKLRDPNNKVVKIIPNIKEDVLFEADICDFMPGESLRNLRIINKLNLFNHTSKTVAQYVSVSGEARERTSDGIVKLIGQANYDTVFSSLCSVISQELKIRGILSLLCLPKQQTSTACQVSCIHNEEPLESTKPERKRKKRLSTPYVVKDVPKKVVISPKHFSTFCNSTSTEESLPELGADIQLDESTNDSVISSFSVRTLKQLMVDPISLISNVDNCTLDSETQRNIKLQQTLSVVESGGTEMCKVENNINLTPGAMLSNMTVEQRNRIKLQQAVNDYKYCLVEDIDGNYPIHVAVLNNDIDMLRRQCLMLKIRNVCVDLPACKTLTALKMALYQENANLTATLLQYGADPLLVDEDYNTAFHIAAEMGGGHLRAIVNHCTKNVRRVLLEDGNLWKPEYETKDEKELAEIFFGYACSIFNNQGYSPLMLASRVGSFENVRQLLRAAPTLECVNLAMPNSGETALYVAVHASILYSIAQHNKSKVADHFRHTVIALLEHGADPNMTTFSNATVHDLIQEASCVELSTLIGNTNSSKIVGKPVLHDCGDIILVKEKDKPIQVQEQKRPRVGKRAAGNNGKSDPKTRRGAPNTSKETVPSIGTDTPKVSIVNVNTKKVTVVDPRGCNIRYLPHTNTSTVEKNTKIIPVPDNVTIVKNGVPSKVSIPKIKIIDSKIMSPGSSTQAINLSKTALAVKRKSSFNTATIIKKPNTND